MNKKIKMGLGIGASSIIMIFVVLCLTTFASLALVTANSDLTMSKKYADYITAYYVADGKAQQWLAQVDEQLAKGEMPEDLTQITAITDQQSLVTTIAMAAGDYRIVSQTVVPNEQWNYEEYQPEFSDIITE